MTCKSCDRVKSWIRGFLGVTEITLNLGAKITKTNQDSCENINALESRVTVLQRQLRVATQTLQNDGLMIGRTIDGLNLRIESLEHPGDKTPYVIEPHKAH